MRNVSRLLLTLLASLWTAQGWAQTCPAEINLATSNAFAFHSAHTGKIRAFQSTPEARAVVDRIVSSVGLPAPFIICETTDPNANAFAIVDGGKRYIAYSKDFMSQLKVSTGAAYWSLLSIMAHEVGHHFSFHTYDNTEAHKGELEADLFSGFIVAKLGAKLDDAQAAMKKVATPQDTPTHPGLARRLAAIEAGWNRGTSNGTPNARPAPDRAATQSAVARIEKWADHFVDGDGYDKRVATAYADCESRCLSDARCLMMEFYRPTKMCNLFAKTSTAKAATSADVGMKRSAVTGIAPVKTGTSIQKLSNQYVEGDGYAKSQVPDYATCEARCKADGKCLMVEFFKPTQSCNLFSEARGHFPSKEADIGVRR